MATVMISLPDELLEKVDAQATARGSIRNATIRELAAEDIDDVEHAAALALLRVGDLATLDLPRYETTTSRSRAGGIRTPPPDWPNESGRSPHSAP